MIRFLRTASILLCVVSVLIYGVVSVNTRRQSDKKAPEISMEENEITLSTQDGLEAVLSGVSAYDKKDGDVTASLVVERISNFVEDGCREVTIAAFDEQGNVKKVSRKVRYSDYTSPRITLSGPLRVAVNNSADLMNVIQVQDCLDGDITANLQITSEETVSSTNPGEYQMHLQVSNSAGDVTDLPVTVEYYDYSNEARSPHILLTEYLVYTKAGQTLDPASYLKGLKIREIEYDWESANSLGFTRESVSIEDTVDYNTPGTYEIVYKIVDSDGNSGKVRLIVVVEA